MEDKILRINDVVRLTTISKSTLWRMEKDGMFPKRRNITASIVGWLKSDIEAWMKKLKEEDDG